MWSKNALTERLNLRFPIFQAPMGEHSPPDLATAVSNAGGLGGIGMWGFTVEEAENRILAFRQRSTSSLNVNYPLWQATGHHSDADLEMRSALQKLYDRKGLGIVPMPVGSDSSISTSHLDMLVRTRPETVSFHFGLPEPHVIDVLKENGITVMCSATTVDEARLLEARGIDFIIAQSAEAGGHQGTIFETDTRVRLGLFSLLPQVVDAVDVPVIAAGGIADGRGIAAALMLGASAVQIGTAFLRCGEAGISDGYRAALANAKDTSTIITNVVSGRHARAISNRLVETLEESGAAPLPFPAQYGLTLPLEKDDDPDFLGLLAGQSVALTREMPATDLMSKLVEETNRCLSLIIK